MNLLRHLTLVLLGFFACQINAQFGKNCELRQVKVNLLNPGLEYEMALGTNTTLDVKAGLQFALDPLQPDVYKELAFLPAIAGQYRYYYNFGSRQRNRRQIYGNSANYVAPAAAVFFPGTRTVENREVKGAFGYVGAVTGLQRSYNSGFNFSVDVGAAYYTGQVDGGVYPVANLSIGWIISEKRWCVGR
ncbi:hypothetical protein [Pseudozobellia thermophila]|uniref:Outer membrane protein beta-barrel domain-containing protein n=1 Tax=Pseudozobellia thermophila TaxID=192903 RepID=A0A1M6HE74_9FLAO|nr:hypothetical protein [Pseudozobellia thermophila]SHJ20492.1 hypothetical protein SAMN04488513_10319 [Pseudozobellia thermophila]